MSKSRFATHPIYFPFERVLLAISSVCVCVCVCINVCESDLGLQVPGRFIGDPAALSGAVPSV